MGREAAMGTVVYGPDSTEEVTTDWWVCRGCCLFWHGLLGGGGGIWTWMHRSSIWEVGGVNFLSSLQWGNSGKNMSQCMESCCKWSYSTKEEVIWINAIEWAMRWLWKSVLIFDTSLFVQFHFLWNEEHTIFYFCESKLYWVTNEILVLVFLLR